MMCKPGHHKWSEIIPEFTYEKKYCKKLCGRYEYYNDGVFSFAVNIYEPDKALPEERQYPE